MLLEARFLAVLRFRFGVRVEGVVDEDLRGRAGRSACGAGATARSRVASRWARWTTSSGSGLDSGEVEFRIHVVSRPARIPNPPIVRLGFRIFGRRQQVRFAQRACERMACLLGVDHPPRALDERAVRT